MHQPLNQVRLRGFLTEPARLFVSRSGQPRITFRLEVWIDDADLPPKKPAGVSDTFWQMFGAKVPTAKAAAADDLVGGIKGIGPVTGKRLNELGVYTYAQVACFDAEIIGMLAEHLGMLPQKITKEDWAGQARKKIAGS